MKLFTLIILSTASILTQAQTFTEVIKASAFDRSAEDRMGYAVDISGDYAIVGAYGDDFSEFDPNMGSAYIFEKTGIEDWAFVQKINNSDQDDYDRFGWSVAIDGDYAVVGAYGEDHDVDDDNSMSKAGSAYIFERDAFGSWNEVQKIVASDRDTSDEYGWTVDVSDNTIIVGAHQEDHDAVGGDFIFRSGSVYVYDRGDDGVWTETQKVVAWDRQADSGGGDEDLDIWHYQDIDYGDLFGCSIGLSGDYMIVGAHNGDYNVDGVWGIDQAGAAYIFKRDAGVWGADQKVIATVRGGWDRYGYSVAIDSNVAVVGAKAEDHSEFEGAFLHNAGSAYIYTRDIAGVWGVQKIDASDRDVGDHFGIEVAIDGNYMVIGADAQNYDEDVADELSNAGAAYIFEKAGDDSWEEIQKIDASDRDSLDVFGDAVAISGHTILVGAWQQDLDSASLLYTEDAGAAYFFSSITCTAETFTQDVDLCAGESIEVGLSVYTETGTYVDTLLNSDACDSIVTTNLSVAPVITSSETVDLCFGETYEIGGSVYDESGTYLDTLMSDIGCDSLVTTELTIAADNLVEQSFNICSGESVNVGESVYTESGTYTDIFEFDDACDSTVITTVDVITDIDITLDDSDLPDLTSNEPEGGSTSYQWIKCDPFEIIDGATEISYTPTEDGEYAVIIEKDFCIDTSACYSVEGVGIQVSLFNEVRIYPNPSKGQLTIELAQGMENGQITLYNNLGAIVSQVYIENKTATFDFSALANGIYFVHIISEGKTSYSKIRITK
ncbi:MAG: T9SS type A sorting domain-containing protein [Crocinitomix sp.]|nr:T9SS type A sorting domain-containing protein [Crocinitomix sp.]